MKYVTLHYNNERNDECLKITKPMKEQRESVLWWGPVMTWSPLCLVKLCGSHLTSAFSLSGIRSYNYAIMGLFPRTAHPPLWLQCNASFFFLFFFLGCFLLLVFVRLASTGSVSLNLNTVWVWVGCVHVFSVKTPEHGSYLWVTSWTYSVSYSIILLHLNGNY